MRIVLKGFDDTVSKNLTEAFTAGIPIEYCISIVDNVDRIPDLGNAEHVCMSADKLRKGLYPDVNWNEVAPLDEELIESMRECEAVFMHMVGRYAIYDDLSYEERKQQYFRHLRFWSAKLDAEHIDLFVLRGPPHQCYDLVIYDLCKKKGIRTLSICPFHALASFTVEENWWEVGRSIRKRYDELLPQYEDDAKEIPLSDEFEEHFVRFSQEKKALWYMHNIDTSLNKRSFVAKWIGPALRVLLRKPQYLFRSVISIHFWRRKLDHHATRSYYDAHAKQPDLTVPFVYVPLHLQPEASTCPMGGAYVHQELLVQLLAAYLPEGIRVYIKENPKQGERMRSIAFYKALLDIPSVTLVPRNFSTFSLTENAVAVAAVTGTACFEGVFKGKPALMFGHKHFQYAPGIYRVHSAEDCKQAIEEIFTQKKRPTLRELRLYLKAVEDVAGLDHRREPGARPPETFDERSRRIGEYTRAFIAS